MPQLNGGGGDDLGANDELISFKDEGEQEKISENVSAEGDLDDVKSSLVNESENNSSSNASDSEQTERRYQPKPTLESSEKYIEYYTQALRRQQDGGLFKSPHYPGYPFLMIPDLTNHYLSSGALSPSARAFLPLKWPLLDIPPAAALKDSRSPTPGHLQSNKVPAVQHSPHLHPLSPLITYSSDHFSPTSPPAHLSPEILDPKTGIPRMPHPSELSPYYPLSPGAVGQIPHPLGWLMPQQGQPMYSIPTAGFRSPYPALAVSPSMSSLVSSRFSTHVVTPPLPGLHQTGIPHPAIVSPTIKREPDGHGVEHLVHTKASVAVKREEERKPHIKKPLNAFMLYMKEMRAKVVAECTLKESAAINQILGRRWHSLTREEQAKYYDLARKERQLHSQLYPGWSARDNYGKRKKRKREGNRLNSQEDAILTESKKPYVPHIPPEKTCDSPASSHGGMLDSPATPTTALASPAAPAPTHSEQAQPLSLTTRPEGRPRPPFPLPNEAYAPPSSSSSSSSSDSTQPNVSLRQTTALLSRPIAFSSLAPSMRSPPTSFQSAMLNSHRALIQSQPLSLVTKSAD